MKSYYKPNRPKHHHNYKKAKKKLSIYDANCLLYNQYIGIHNMPYFLDKSKGLTEQEIYKLIVCTGEIPSDLWINAPINPSTYRVYLTNLRKKKRIKTHRTKDLKGYVLTPSERYMKDLYGWHYEKPSSDLNKRKRMHNLTVIYCFFCFFGFHLADYENHSYFDYNIFNAKKIKRLDPQKSPLLNRSKAYAYISVRERIAIVYYTALYEIFDFYAEEVSFKKALEQHLKCRVTDGVMLCRSVEVAQMWAYSLFHFDDYHYGDNYIEQNFDKFCMLVTDKNADLAMSIYEREDDYIKLLINHFKMSDNNGIYYYRELPVHFLLNFDLIKLKKIIFSNAHKNAGANSCSEALFCCEYMKPAIDGLLLRNNNLKVYGVKFTLPDESQQ